MADDREDFMHAINEFLDSSIVLPPGELDEKTLLPIVNQMKAKSKAREDLEPCM